MKSLVQDLVRTGLAVTAVTGTILLPAYLLHSPTGGASKPKAPKKAVSFTVLDTTEASYGRAINDRGDYVGRISKRVGHALPFVVRNEKMEILPLPNGMHQGVANAINADGVVVGNIGIEQRAHGARWRNGTVETLTGDHKDAMATTVSRDGTAAGISADISRRAELLQNVPAVGVIWDDAGDARILDDFVPSAGNQEGTLAGQLLKRGNTYPALFKKNRVVLLPTVERADRVVPMAISTNETVAGVAVINKSRYLPLLWTKDGVRLLPVPDNQTGIVYGVNDQKIAVGVINTKSRVSHAAAWEDGKVMDLNDLIDTDSGWTLVEAYGINNRGQIVGTGVKNGRSAAFVLKYP